MSQVIMAGSLGDFDVPAVLQAVGLSRQYTLVQLWDEQKQPSGEIRIKAGQVVEAACNDDRGRSAFSSILSRAHDTFRVERMSDPASFPEPLGSLSALLLSSVPPRLERKEAAKPKPAKSSKPKLLAVREPASGSPAAVPAASKAAASKPPAKGVKASPMPQTVAANQNTALRTVAADDALEQILRGYAHLDAAIIFSAARPQRAQSWDRHRDSKCLSDLAGIVWQTVQASTTASSTTPALRWTMEFQGFSVVVQRCASGEWVAYRFSAQRPLGLVRHCVTLVHAELTRYLGASSEHQAAAI